MYKSTNNLKSLRKAKGLTLHALFGETGVPVSSIGAFEKGTRPLKAEHQQALEKFFGVEIVEVHTEEPALSSIVSEESEHYRVRLKIWREASNTKLEELLSEYANEKDWGAVREISRELLDRKLTDKLRSNGE